MRRWAVTGPMGAGKSTVARLLADRGAAVVDGDELGHRVLARPEVVEAVARRFGTHCVRDGAVDRRALGAVVFADPEAMRDLNALTHPPLVELARRELDALDAAGGRALAVLEAAVYFLWPDPPRVDLVVAVVAPRALRRERLAARGGLAPEAIERRIAAQSAMEPDWQRADVVLDNGGDAAALAAAVDELWDRHLGRDAAGGAPTGK